jgi:hypothetical protein
MSSICNVAIRAVYGILQESLLNNNYSNQHITSIFIWVSVVQYGYGVTAVFSLWSVMNHVAVKQRGAGVLAGWSAAVAALVAGKLNAGVAENGTLQLVSVAR